jgi:hypothetical protein
MKKYLKITALIISVLTLLSGLVQMIKPDFILAFIGGDTSQANRHSFGIIGMFMALFGGLVIHTIYEAKTSKTILFWAALQKIGAAIAVGLAIQKGLFNYLAGLVAAFDLVSGILFLIFRKNIDE